MNDDMNNRWNHLKTVTVFEPGGSNELFSPSSILIESLIEHICSFLEEDKVIQKRLYLIICRKLNELDLIDDSYRIESLNYLRTEYKIRLWKLVDLAKAIINSNDGCSQSCLSITRKSERRSESEYVTIQYLAGGGFGHVYEMKHILDARKYAVKQISLRDYNGNVHSGLERSMVELRLLGSLRHQNIVPYMTAWMESQDKVPRNKEIDYPSETSRTSTSESSTSSGSIVFQDDSQNGELNDESLSLINNSETKIIKQDKTSSLSVLLTGNTSIVSDKNKEYYMYIQMELCDMTLEQWIQKRTNEKEPVDLPQSISKFCDVVRAIEFIHSKSVVHHDVKTSNVFIGIEDGRAKLGDFGLACCSPDASRLIDLQCIQNCPIRLSKNPSQVGTKRFAAPEQLNGTCDPKNDIYSLGVVLFDLLVSSVTQMEKMYIFQNFLKGGDVPEICKEYPRINHLLKRMLSSDMNRRPSAYELLQEMEELCETLNRNPVNVAVARIKPLDTI